MGNFRPTVYGNVLTATADTNNKILIQGVEVNTKKKILQGVSFASLTKKLAAEVTGNLSSNDYYNVEAHDEFSDYVTLRPSNFRVPANGTDGMRVRYVAPASSNDTGTLKSVNYTVTGGTTQSTITLPNNPDIIKLDDSKFIACNSLDVSLSLIDSGCRNANCQTDSINSVLRGTSNILIVSNPGTNNYSVGNYLVLLDSTNNSNRVFLITNSEASGTKYNLDVVELIITKDGTEWVTSVDLNLFTRVAPFDQFIKTGTSSVFSIEYKNNIGSITIPFTVNYTSNNITGITSSFRLSSSNYSTLGTSTLEYLFLTYGSSNIELKYNISATPSETVTLTTASSLNNLRNVVMNDGFINNLFEYNSVKYFTTKLISDGWDFIQESEFITDGTINSDGKFVTSQLVNDIWCAKLNDNYYKISNPVLVNGRYQYQCMELALYSGTINIRTSPTRRLSIPRFTDTDTNFSYEIIKCYPGLSIISCGFIETAPANTIRKNLALAGIPNYQNLIQVSSGNTSNAINITFSDDVVVSGYDIYFAPFNSPRNLIVKTNNEQISTKRFDNKLYTSASGSIDNASIPAGQALMFYFSDVNTDLAYIDGNSNSYITGLSITIKDTNATYKVRILLSNLPSEAPNDEAGGHYMTGSPEYFPVYLYDNKSPIGINQIKEGKIVELAFMQKTPLADSYFLLKNPVDNHVTTSYNSFNTNNISNIYNNNLISNTTNNTFNTTINNNTTNNTYNSYIDNTTYTTNELTEEAPTVDRTGEIIMYADYMNRINTLPCDGSKYKISEYPALFNLLKYRYATEEDYVKKETSTTSYTLVPDTVELIGKVLLTCRKDLSLESDGYSYYYRYMEGTDASYSSSSNGYITGFTISLPLTGINKLREYGDLISENGNNKRMHYVVGGYGDHFRPHFYKYQYKLPGGNWSEWIKVNYNSSGQSVSFNNIFTSTGKYPSEIRVRAWCYHCRYEAHHSNYFVEVPYKVTITTYKSQATTDTQIELTDELVNAEYFRVPNLNKRFVFGDFDEDGLGELKLRGNVIHAHDEMSALPLRFLIYYQ